MKKIRTETTEYWQTDTGGVVVKIEERQLIREIDGKEVWDTELRTIPLLYGDKT